MNTPVYKYLGKHFNLTGKYYILPYYLLEYYERSLKKLIQKNA
jgi:hypothetical protein